jgi:hypothetical protein
VSSGSNQRGLAELRKQTKFFIDDDPTGIRLIPSSGTEDDDGGIDYEDSTERDLQWFKLINSLGDFDGIVRTSDGQVRRYNYVLLGEHNAVVNIGDHWQDGDTYYEVISMLVKNDYEVKAAVQGYGKDPNYG